MNLKQFDLEKALSGEPVVTRNGLTVSEIIVLKSIPNEYKVVGVINGTAYFFSPSGEFIKDGIGGPHLFMAPVKHQEWVNIYKSDNKCGYELGPTIYRTENEAKIGSVKEFNYITTVKISEWEE